jgi:hypothetical protein
MRLVRWTLAWFCVRVGRTTVVRRCSTVTCRRCTVLGGAALVWDLAARSPVFAGFAEVTFVCAPVVFWAGGAAAIAGAAAALANKST